MLPKGWRQVPLHTVAEIRTGLSKNANREGATLKRPYIRVANVQDGALDLADVREIDVPAKQAARYTLQAGDLLLIEGNGNPENLGRCCLWRGQVPDAIHQNHVFVVRTLSKEELLPEFLEQQTQSEYGRNYFLSCAKGSTGLSSLNSSQVKSFPLLIPPPSEQHRIALILSTWDQAINKAERLLQSSHMRKGALTRDLVFGKTRFSQFDTPWQRFAFRDVLKEVKRRVEWDDEQEYPLISVRRRSEGAFHRETLRGSEILTKKLNYAYEGEFLISKMQVVHGAMAVVPAALDGLLVSDSYLAFQSADEDRFDINFIGWLSTTQQMYKAVRRCSYGVHIEKMTFDLEMFLGEKLHIPKTLEEQRLICAVLEGAQAEVKAAADHLEQLKREKAALMSQLLTGKRHVKLPDAEAEARA